MGCGARRRRQGLAGLVTATQAPPVRRAPEGTEGQAAVPVGGGGAWPGFETTHPATHSDTSAAGVEGPEGQAAVPVGGGRARARFEPTHQSASATGRHWVERPDTQAAVPMR